MPIRRLDRSGTTLVELLVAVGIFALFIAVLLPSFTAFRRQADHVAESKLLNSRGQQVMNFLVEEIKMAGFLVGPYPNLVPCADSGVAGAAMTGSVQHTDGDPYDSIEWVTSDPIETDQVNTYYLQVNEASGFSTSSFHVNVADESAVSEAWIRLSTDAGKNGKALITFDTLSPTVLDRVYQISSFNTDQITLTSAVAQQIPDRSRVYAVRRYGFDTDGNRGLVRTRWTFDCTKSSEVVDFSFGGGNSLGGIDGLQFEYDVLDAFTGAPSTQTSIAVGDLERLAGIRIWLLLRADAPDRDYTNSETYDLGTDDGTGSPLTGVSLGPYNDHYRRLLLTKTVEVKNLVY